MNDPYEILKAILGQRTPMGGQIQQWNGQAPFGNGYGGNTSAARPSMQYTSTNNPQSWAISGMSNWEAIPSVLPTDVIVSRAVKALSSKTSKQKGKALKKAMEEAEAILQKFFEGGDPEDFKSFWRIMRALEDGRPNEVIKSEATIGKLKRT